MNFHIFVLISSVLFYIFLRSYKYNILTSKSSLKKSSNKRRRNKKNSNLIYALFLPIVLYTFYYIFIYKPNNITLSQNTMLGGSPGYDIKSVFSDNGLTQPYPITASDNSMSSIF
jgi:hypothetical protein